MASANSLLGLVNQLQSMEHHFTSILFETILKLTSLTDAKLFILVESQDCRRIAGAEHLCRSFADGLLQPIASDRHVYVQQDVFALSEEPLPSSASSSSHNASSDMDVRVMSIHGSNGETTHSNRKRPSPGGGGFQHHRRPSRPPKERRMMQQRPFKTDPDIKAFSSADLHEAAAATSAEASYSVDHEALGDGVDENGFSGANSAAGINDTQESGEDFTIEDDSFAEILFTKPASLDDSVDDLGADDSSAFNNSVGHSASSSSSSRDDGVGMNSESRAVVAVSAPVSNHDLSFIEEFMRTNHKVGPVLSIYDDSVTEKNSVSNKVTLSLVYDFAKCLFSNCAYASFKDWGFREFFEAAFEKFWHNFPNFSVWEGNNMRFQERVDKRTNMCRMATPKSFLRQKIRINVINLMLTKTKGTNNGGQSGGRITKKSLPYF